MVAVWDFTSFWHNFCSVLDNQASVKQAYCLLSLLRHMLPSVGDSPSPLMAIFHRVQKSAIGAWGRPISYSSDLVIDININDGFLVYLNALCY